MMKINKITEMALSNGKHYLVIPKDAINEMNFNGTTYALVDIDDLPEGIVKTKVKEQIVYRTTTSTSSSRGCGDIPIYNSRGC